MAVKHRPHALSLSRPSPRSKVLGEGSVFARVPTSEVSNRSGFNR